MPVARLRSDFDAIVLAAGAGQPRDLSAPGRELQGIHFAMEYLTLQNRRCQGDEVPDDQFISARGRHVVIIGGGDTGADCLGTVHRQGAKSVTQLELLPNRPSIGRLTTRGPNGPTSSACRPPTKRAANGGIPFRRSGSSVTMLEECGRCRQRRSKR